MAPHPIQTYFAYGSNMNTDRVQERGLSTTRVEPAQLAGFQLLFNKAGKHHQGVGHANIERSIGACVEGVLYHLQRDDEILKMDPFERAPWNYGREVVLVETTRGPCWTWTYFANRAVTQPGLRPSVEYLGHLLAGEPFLSRDYFAMLRDWPTL